MPRYAALQRAHRAALVLLVVAPAVLCAQTRRSGFATDRLARIDRVMQQYVDSGQVGGAVGLVLEDGRVVYRHAVGWLDKEAGRRMTSDALFRIASQTKAITTVAILSLVEEGKIMLGDPVSRFIPAFAHTTVWTKSDTGLVVKPTTRAITIRELLTHTAGISYGTDGLIAPLYAAKALGPAAGWGWYTADKDEPICATMERLATLPFTAQPGEKWVYGYNTDILGCVAERASGMPLDELIRTRITGPLKMNDTYFFVPAGQAARLATVYASDSTNHAQRAPDGPRGQGNYVDGPLRGDRDGVGRHVQLGRRVRQRLLRRSGRAPRHRLHDQSAAEPDRHRGDISHAGLSSAGGQPPLARRPHRPPTARYNAAYAVAASVRPCASWSWASSCVRSASSTWRKSVTPSVNRRRASSAARSLAALASTSRCNRSRAVRYRVMLVSTSASAASTTRPYSARAASSRACAASTSVFTLPR